MSFLVPSTPRSIATLSALVCLTGLSTGALAQSSGTTTDTNPAAGAASAPAPSTNTTAGDTAATKDIVDTAAAAGTFSTLQTALTQAGLVDTLKGTGPFTVFAPTDAAFKKVPKKQLDALLANKELLAETLKHHVVSGTVKASDVVGLKSASPLAGGDIPVKVRGKGSKATVMLGKSKVTQTDIMASNGVIHVIDTVIIPADVAKKLR